MLTTLQVVVYAFALWLGLYLLQRNPAKPPLLLAAAGLVAYALALAAGILAGYTLDPGAVAILERLYRLLIAVPALCWGGAFLYLLPEQWPLRPRLLQLWRLVILPLAGLLLLLAAFTDLMLTEVDGVIRPTAAYLLLALLVLLPLVLGFGVVAALFRSLRPQRPYGLLLFAALFFGLSAGLLLFPLGLLPAEIALLAIAPDMLLLGLAIALLDAFEEGESLRADMLRSFLSAALSAAVFGALVTLAALSGPGLSFPMLVLLLAILAAAIALRVFAGSLEQALNRLAFAGSPRLRREEERLHMAADSLPRVDADLDLAALDDAEYVRLTRRALSHYGDLARLSTNPLTRLPIVEARLARRGAPGDTIERAVELKALLAEAIARLKPRGSAPFGTTDEWRYYNALYFPYVRGLKPYSRRLNDDHADPIDRQALAWFGDTVPERTLYNWQTAGARLIADELRRRD